MSLWLLNFSVDVSIHRRVACFVTIRCAFPILFPKYVLRLSFEVRTHLPTPPRGDLFVDTIDVATPIRFRSPSALANVRTASVLPRTNRNATTASGASPALAPTAPAEEHPKRSLVRRRKRHLPHQEAGTAAAVAAKSSLNVAVRASFP